MLRRQRGARRGGVKGMWARDARRGGLRACLRPGMTEGGLHTWWGLFSSLVQYHYITPPVPGNPVSACHSNSLRSNSNTRPLLSPGGWWCVKEKPIHNILLLGLRGRGWIRWAGGQWTAFRGHIRPGICDNTLVFFFLLFFKKHYLNSVFPSTDYEGWNPTPLLTDCKTLGKSHDRAKPQILHL